MIQQIICTSNSDRVLLGNLLRSPLCNIPGLDPVLIRSGSSASARFSETVARSTRRGALAFVHQDVYLPCDWEVRVARQLASLPDDWGVVGVCGIDSEARVHSHLWSSGLGRVIGGPFEARQCVSLDEVVLILRAGCGIDFDPQMPGFHLYGADICRTALKIGRGVYAIDAPVIHNSMPVALLDSGYKKAYRYLQQKWADDLPLETCVVRVTRTIWPVWRFNLRQLRRGRLRRGGGTIVDPAAKAAELGFNHYVGERHRSSDL
ncbi:hypothetical protein Thimo_3073 [Thioflavicoccus mobilis 8321]|uniref:Glycosyltransferase n=1 Tax=Thioflavicoccus mobilis 8321 TaxID=765912 RepID=L0H2E3_9GAMM|nr:hypothetical protein Thimo_3073 [Thioflavicoccus mobilis 8321]